ncbi:ATP-binding cassette domain-containing protein [Hoeflea sp. WL0058]|uniref:ATP-binding cassette domain-containing protein n=1 Tax=Flavimaribacter sediminis TaxID=2865987 RepID=A0AAE2ZS65_9HYPH|nr:oligopeptide/dipeptide ABC transporter ATP-binding protein [Flavimaribacter sediminis]MBW8639523.1 ATP-binding cassette domain-containing protein [Flavimaribacter sediminis]
MTGYLVLDNVGKTYTLKPSKIGGAVRHVHAVDGVSLEVARGETLGLVGESGCGKSTLAKLIMHLEVPTGGRVVIDGVDHSRLRGPALKQARRNFQMIFQDPQASLNPRMKARAIIGEILGNYGKASSQRVDELAALVGLGDFHLDRYPHQLSGGQCQRIGIARAIALDPGLIIADEPVSALDVSIQAQILNLIGRLRQQLDLTMVFISHDLSVVSHVADRVAVMYLGRIVEIGRTESLFRNPRHPYTRMLLEAVPQPTPAKRHARAAVSGELPSPIDPPSGCHFRTRCAFAGDECSSKVPVLRPADSPHMVACHKAETIASSLNMNVA